MNHDADRFRMFVGDKLLLESGRRKFMQGLLAAAGGAAGLSLRSAEAGAATRTITYYGNQSVTVPQIVTRVATSWPAQNSIITMLGYGSKIVATTSIASQIPAFRRLVPSIVHAAVINQGRDVNIELLIAMHPDVFFVPRAFSPIGRAQLEKEGIAVVALHDNSIKALLERTLITGQILGPDAYTIAQAYQIYFARNKERVAARLAEIPQNQRLKLYLASGSPLHSSARPSLDQDWMDLAGAINIAEHWQVMGNSGHGTVSTNVEAILEADPDAIICLNPNDVGQINNNPQWHGIKAVRNGRVYANPRGLFWWCRETTEQALQFLWVAKTLYPAAFSDIDMVSETKDFYKKFYRAELSDADAANFLHPTG